MLPIALTIAGSDSSGGAGIQADLKAMMALGVYGASVLTTITAQNTHSVTAVHELPPAFITAQLDAVASDLQVGATKTGMLGSQSVIEAVVDGVKRHDLGPLVVDPVMISTSGATLLPADALTSLKRDLLPLATLVTPNSLEAARLARRPVSTLQEARTAALAIAELGGAAVLIKGGHLDPTGERAIDLLWDGQTFTTFSQPRLDVRHTHGTGCTYGSAIAARLAHGDELVTAIATARAYLQGAIAHGLDIGHGAGPTDHGWLMNRQADFSQRVPGWSPVEVRRLG